MHLEIDTVYPAPRGGTCRVRIYQPDNETDQTIVIVSELAGNEGMSVTTGADRIAAEIMDEYDVPAHFVYIEHYPAEARPGYGASYDLVTFADFRIRKEAPDYRGEGPVLRLGGQFWKPLGRAAVETLVGQELEE